MSLSEKIIFNAKLPTWAMEVGKIYREEDVKQAVKELKERLDEIPLLKHSKATHSRTGVEQLIDEIFGEKLI